MRTIFTMTFLSLLVWGCSKKMAPEKSALPASNTGSVTVNKSTVPENVSNPSSPSDLSTLFSASDTAATKKVLRAGTQTQEVMAQIAGQSTFNAKCSRCHQLRVTTNYTSDRWAAVMAVMSNATHANLSEAERTNVLAYVQANSKH